MMTRREENTETFRDTERMCKTCQRLRDAVDFSRSRQRLVLSEDEVARPASADGQPCNVIVSAKRTFEAAAAYARTMRTCVLNFASATHPGGGVVNGSSAQEESLCRTSTLYFNLNVREMWDGFYSPHRRAGNPLHSDDIIYTPRVVVFKRDTDRPTLLAEGDWYEVDVISCAAPNLREKPSNRMNAHDGNRRIAISPDDLRRLHERRLARILDVASANGAEAVVLGAFGCGAFRNDPTVVASAAAAVIPSYRTLFRTIEFAVYCRPGDASNYTAFRNIMRSMMWSKSRF
ncbi:MAG: TIGR02452 family protein [Kiritimatiellae bacterium]|nr:TIGR02452 family protein [Kiritimatiellia bacterium]